MTARGVTSARGRLAIVASLLAVLALGLGPVAHPEPASAGTAETMEADILSWINAERDKRGLVPLRRHGGLANLAGDRAATMASSGQLKHADCLGCLLDARGIPWYANGETIGYTSWPWGDQAARTLYEGWKGSSLHWSILMSDRYNYVGVGVAYRSANATTWGAIVLTEAVDQTKPWGKVVSGSRNGDDVTWKWTGADVLLQTHTAGLRNYDVKYRVDGGSWKIIRKGTTATSLTLADRAGGHWYAIKVRARDGRGLVSTWSAKVRVWVP